MTAAELPDPNRSEEDAAESFEGEFARNQGPDDLQADDLDLETLLRYEREILNAEVSNGQSNTSGIDPSLVQTIRLLHQTLGPHSLGTSNRLESTSHDEWQLPDPFGRFQIISKLGSGSFGAVWKAHDPVLKRLVAIKVLHPTLRSIPELNHRFVTEAQAVARLNHPSIVRIHEAGMIDSISYLAAEFIDGRKLSSQDDVTANSYDHSAKIVSQLAEAMEHSHAHGVLHRDIKPDNILMESTTGVDGIQTTTARLTDFGLARIQDQNTEASTAGLLVGTIDYMSPEQLMGQTKALGPPTDIYSLGVVLYQLLTNELPRKPEGNVYLAIEQSLAIRTPRSLRGDVPRDLDAICMRCLEREPIDRFQSASELHADLRRYLEGRATLTRPPTMVERVWRWSRHHRSLAAALLVILACSGLTLSVVVRSAYQLVRHNAELSRAWEIGNAAKLDALTHQEQYRQLAWVSDIQRICTLNEQFKLLSASQSLASLLKSHPDATSRPEWNLLQAELANQFDVLLEVNYPLREVVAIPNSSLIALAGDSPHLSILDLKTKHVVRQLDLGLTQIHALAVSQDGLQLAVGGTTTNSDRARPILVNLKDFTHSQLSVSGPTTIESLAFSSDSQYLAIAFRYQGAKLVNLKNPEETPIKVEGGRRGQQVGWLDSLQAAVVHTDRRVFSLIGPTVDLRHFSAVRDLDAFAVIPKTNWVVMTADNSESSVVDCLQDKPLFKLQGKRNTTLCLAVSPDGKWVAFGGKNGEVIAWQLESPVDTALDDEAISPFASAFLLDGSVTSIAWSESDLIAVGDDGRATRWSPAANERQLGDGRITAAKYSTEGTEIILGFEDGSIRRTASQSLPTIGRWHEASWKTADAHLLAPPRGSAVTTIATNSEGNLFAAGYADGQVKVFSADGALQKVLASGRKEESGQRIYDLKFAPNDAWLAWGDENNHVHLWPTDGTREPLGSKLTANVECVEFAGDSEVVAIGGEFEGIRQFKVPTGESIAKFGSTSTRAILFNQAKQELLAGSTDGILRIHDSQTMEVKNTIRAHNFSINSICQLKHNELALTTDDHAEIRLSRPTDGLVYGGLSQNNRLLSRSAFCDVTSEFSADQRFVFVLIEFLSDGKTTNSVFRQYRLTN